uniref:Uncharacterized protein n=1 Tax=Corethron hystrix TaxID=216773 RepID=A0A7S1FSX8_9STRA|mmetsp:Transcript_26220/g.60279  ORF Transcript_26220/g.60279 Transcript_26220/m.60279 type:complete len:117 (+) Transcript_26220:3020-3370(+)
MIPDALGTIDYLPMFNMMYNSTYVLVIHTISIVDLPATLHTPLAKETTMTCNVRNVPNVSANRTVIATRQLLPLTLTQRGARKKIHYTPNSKLPFKHQYKLQSTPLFGKSLNTVAY